MRVAGYIGGGQAAERRKYQIGEAMANAGVVVLHPTLANTDGLRLTSTTNSEDAVGLTMDAQATRNTAQQSDGSDPAVKVTVDVNPSAIIEGRFCGGATSGTALTAVSNTTQSTTGLLITFSASQSTYDDGVAWGATGSNPGILRKITAVTTTATPIIAYPADIEVNDQFYLATFGPMEDKEIQFTSDFTEVDITASNTSNKTLRCLDFEGPKGADEDGATKSVGYFYFSEHLLGGASI